ncbi:LPXTG cell wall anchor domain-containing protein [Streptomyces sp. NPDC088846]|uniref:LPXTG cell wall anchor domain-containing protein n=1 Tax=Streptomyces sp. NPDC088846 TaxID=3365908 RepID=UPI00381E6A3D
MPSADPSLPATAATEETTPKAPDGSLAHTGADATPWFLGVGGLLVAAGSGALITARRRKPAEPCPGRQRRNQLVPRSLPDQQAPGSPGACCVYRR